jgi:alkylhydroperoxidase family enzyme
MSTTATTFEQPRLKIARHARGAYGAMSTLDGQIELDASLRDLISLRASILNGCA